MSVNSGLKATKIIGQRKAFYRQRIPGFSRARKETEETNHNINVKVKFKTYFQLKVISSIYPHGCITESWRYYTWIGYLTPRFSN